MPKASRLPRHPSREPGVPCAARPAEETSLPEDAYALVHRSTPLLIVISGPSGVGKDATVQRMKDLGLPFYFVVTANTRPPRSGEVDGVDYQFVSREQFQQLIDQDELLEYALVYGDYKGVPKAQVREALASGTDVVLRLDVQGAATVRRLVPGAILIFLMASSQQELADRLMSRNTDSAADQNLRLDTARQEVQRVYEFDYVIVNSHCHLDDTVEQIRAIIRAEKRRVIPHRIAL